MEDQEKKYLLEKLSKIDRKFNDIPKYKDNGESNFTVKAGIIASEFTTHFETCEKLLGFKEVCTYQSNYNIAKTIVFNVFNCGDSQKEE
jgi:hypothetical protein